MALRVQLTLVCLALSLYACAQRTIFIHTPNDTCQQENCFTLDDYTVYSARNSTISNTTIIFFRGEHSLSRNLSFRNINNLMLLGYARTSVISCMEGIATGSTIAFVNITNMTINGLNITNCGTEIGEQLSSDAMFLQTRSVHIFDERLKVAIFLINIRSPTIVSTIIERSVGYGLLAVNVLGNSIIYDSVFAENNYRTNTTKCWNATLTTDTAIECQGGNALFLFTDTRECLPPVNFTLTIISSVFARGLDLATGQYSYKYIGSSGGLGVILSQLDYGVKVDIINVLSILNTAKRGANLYIRIHNTVINSSIHIMRCLSTGGNVLYRPLTTESFFDTFGNFAGLYFIHGVVDNSQIVTGKCEGTEQQQMNQTEKGLRIHEEVLTIEDSKFKSNYALSGSGMLLQFYTSFNREDVERIRSVTINRTNITDNTGDAASALLLYDFSSTSLNEPVQVILEKVQIARNRPIVDLTLSDEIGDIGDCTM